MKKKAQRSNEWEPRRHGSKIKVGGVILAESAKIEPVEFFGIDADGDFYKVALSKQTRK